MKPIERGVYPHIHHITGNSENFIDFSTYSECEKKQIEYSYFELEKVFGARKARFINKLNYWLNKCGRNIEDSEAKWIYNTIKDWAEQFNWSLSTLKRIIYSLEEEGVIISKKINARKWNHTKWYSIDYNKLNSFLSVDKELRNYSDKKRANRLAQKEPIIISNTSNNYTNRSSNEEFKRR